MVNPEVTAEQVWDWLHAVEDPEIPVISIVELGIVRDVQLEDSDAGAECVVTLTPTYSGCPATHVIAADVEKALHARGVPRVRIQTRISPAWTTDWLSDEGRRKLRDYGIAPPARPSADRLILVGDIGGRASTVPGGPACPRCASDAVVLISQFSSTPCKALYRCRACLEPFDHFKRH